MNIFVGNLSFSAKEEDVKKLFEGFGSVASCVIVMGKKGIKSRGFGFLEMPDDMQAQSAIAALAGKEFMGRPLKVSPVRPKPEPEIEIESVKHKEEQSFHSVTKRPDALGRERKVFPRREKQEGPARWQKKTSRPKPWQKREGEAKPWREARGGAKPWQKREGEAKPWREARGGAKPWQKREGEAKPWQKRNERPQRPGFKSRGKTGGYKKHRGAE
ncbi:MAG: RNA-binding protein [Candidatus Omnitrophica bacterium]|nr:RNA-binding protein [Candidatus Omnitrophota bacterium]